MSKPLSPAAEAAWSAYNDVMERVGVFEDSGDAIAAFLRVVVAQCSRADRTGSVYMAPADVLAIAAELEGSP